MEEYINNKTIIENEIFLAFKDNVICSLCKNILIFPIICIKCHKVYCKKCIDDWNKNNQECPNGCKEYDYQECLGKNEILSKLKFKCLGCGEKIFYNEVIRHYESGCPEKISLQKSEKESHDFQIDNSSHESETENSSQESKIENLVSNQNKILKESNIERLTKEQVDILKKEGNEISYITGKKIIIFIFYIVTTFGVSGVGKSTLIET